MDYIESIEDLRKVYRPASEGALRKQLTALEPHSKRFMALSPFALIGTQGPDGLGDVTPRGDGPGFAQVLDDRTIALPDRPGNNRLDTLENIVQNPAVGLIFMIPGMNETLRINGTARITADPDMCERLGMNGRPALSVLIVRIEELYMHCSKAFIRSGLWKPETWPERSEMPTLGQILRDQTAIADAAEQIDERLEDNYRKDLW
ncbi:pyridoxamine 5'-phosphate oxidase family protein [Chachezhania antarctica]|uniref:pyridoxamine 5'-phosphate oxidase family protein n=1 Tax=Chachezhania antarctica TaxID=2340860 RepID=UPI000EB26BBC|nr:pyridoxamine 5'-phosphate oxidase family protein [Chachezhania antarctica]|tara:strand:+ start:8612 stop:9226 length:615 start_codon:yes stop_codon:yes gene_type:complete